MFVAAACLAGLMIWGTRLAPAYPGETSDGPEIKRLSDGSSVTSEGCTIERFRIVSPCMGREIKAAVLLPPGYKDRPGKAYPVLYTFVGYDAPYDALIGMSSLRKALKDCPLIVACMDGDRGSFYLDSPQPVADWQRPAKGDKTGKQVAEPVKSLFTTFFFKEYVPCLDQNYRINPQQRMTTGFSMGGFGAFHYMLTKPDFFVSISSMSGALARNNPAFDSAKRLSFLLGDPVKFPERYYEIDINDRIQKWMGQGIKLPAIYLCCGAEDSHALPNNREMHRFLGDQGVPHEYVESPGGHNSKFWMEALPSLVDFHLRTLQIGYTPK